MKSPVLSVSAALAIASAATALAKEAHYGADVTFLAKHVEVVELSDASGQARVAVVPAYQGRVMTSSASGNDGFSFGWVNRELIASGKIQPHINVFGGEDRFWLGPEGGPFSLFFAKDAPEQTLQYWQTPAFIDTLPWRVVRKTRDAVELAADDRLTNRAGSTLTLSVQRAIRLIDEDSAQRYLGVTLPREVKWVGYESENKLTNAGELPWTKETGLPSIWILGMFKPGPTSTLVVPIVDGPEPRLGPAVRSDYFGEVPPDRLRQTNDVVFFRGDGEARGKIGIPARRAKPLAGSWDAARGVLTIVQYNLPADAGSRPYVDSRWTDMADPYAGDVVNAYNDGPPTPGAKPLGPFYELETSSPAAELAPGETLTHVHRTFHFVGPRAALDSLAQRLLGPSLGEIERAFP
jgi:hypothetical protein